MATPKRKSAGVSMTPLLEAQAKARAKTLGLNFSAYVNQLIRADLAKGGGITIDVASLPPSP